jgi:NADH:ubiquinone oxidoreductase subunit 4 (subunit M)
MTEPPVGHDLGLTATEQAWIFWAFFMAFAVKVPMFPVHTWLPKECPKNPRLFCCC